MHSFLRLPARRTVASLSSYKPLSSSLYRPLSGSTSLRLKEDQKDPSPEEAERIKQEQVKKAEKGEGHWHEELASKGESDVKADRQQVRDHDEHMEELQKD